MTKIGGKPTRRKIKPTHFHLAGNVNDCQLDLKCESKKFEELNFTHSGNPIDHEANFNSHPCMSNG